MAAIEKKESPDVARPAGGYRLVGVGLLFAGWWAYRSGLLKLIDLRTYFAALEVASRRCVVRAGTRPRFTIDELSRLLDVRSEREVRRSVSRLSTLGLVRFRPEAVAFARDVGELSFDHDAFAEQFQWVVNRRRRVPVPRRTLRMLARSRGPAVIATVLGHLFRCVYAKGLHLSAEGSVSSTWIAEAFQVDARNVKRARATLRAGGWLEERPSDHWHRQRHGARVEVNLQWNPGCLPALRSPPRFSGQGCKSPPPDTNRKLLNGFKNQKPDSGAGAQKRSVPNLNTVRPEDLSDLSRLLVLFESAQKAGCTGRSENDRLQFVAAAIRARRCATRNACGFFLALVRGRLWHHLQAVDEDEARRKLHAHLHGTPRAVMPPTRTIDAACSSATIPTRDIQLVAQLTQLASERHHPGDPFELIQRQDGWNRDRWDRAQRAWLGVPEPAGIATVPANRIQFDDPLKLSHPPQNRPFHLMEGGIFAGRSGVKVEPSEKRLRVLAE